MRLFLLDNNEKMTKIWELYFRDCSNIMVVCDVFRHFMDTTDVECVVSPANSYGLMDGGFDRAISEWFGWDLMEKVQKYIMEHFKGEQPVGTSFIIDTGIKDIKLIHTPTMRVPSAIRDPMVIYHCMRTCLMTAMENNIKSIVIPAFGGCCGSVRYQTIAEMMWHGYDQLMNLPTDLTWEYAYRWEPERE